MDCRTPFDKYFLCKSIGSKFVNDLFADIAFNRQKHLEVKEELLMTYYTKLDKLEDMKKNPLQYMTPGEKRVTFVKNVNKEIKAVNEELARERVEMHGDGNRILRKYKCAGCVKGVFTDINTKCGRCDTVNCVSCRKPVVDVHVCSEEDIKSVEAIAKMCRECPKCLTPVIKVPGGCDQMFCTECNTPFNFKTGKVIQAGGFHNHHHEVFKKANPGVNIFLREGISNNECVDTDTVNSMVQAYKNTNRWTYNLFCINLISIPNIIDACNESQDSKYDLLREKHMRGKIKDANMRTTLKRDIIERDANFFKRDIYCLMVNTFVEMVISQDRGDIPSAGHLYKVFISNVLEPMINDVWKTRGWSFVPKPMSVL
jgi:hypothetical protein